MQQSAGVMASVGAQREEALRDGKRSHGGLCNGPLAQNARDAGETSVVIGQE